MIKKVTINLCDMCHGTYESCIKLTKPPKIVLKDGKVIECSMFFKKECPIGCVDRESGGKRY